jgi:hypothetical protein
MTAFADLSHEGFKLKVGIMISHKNIMKKEEGKRKNKKNEIEK